MPKAAASAPASAGTAKLEKRVKALEARIEALEARPEPQVLEASSGGGVVEALVDLEETMASAYKVPAAKARSRN